TGCEPVTQPRKWQRGQFVVEDRGSFGGANSNDNKAHKLSRLISAWRRGSANRENRVMSWRTEFEGRIFSRRRQSTKIVGVASFYNSRYGKTQMRQSPKMWKDSGRQTALFGRVVRPL
ncbi:hypothetical protein ALC56_07525, partial [Trachymyrmex septentrionalis]